MRTLSYCFLGLKVQIPSLPFFYVIVYSQQRFLSSRYKINVDLNVKHARSYNRLRTDKHTKHKLSVILSTKGCFICSRSREFFFQVLSSSESSSTLDRLTADAPYFTSLRFGSTDTVKVRENTTAGTTLYNLYVYDNDGENLNTTIYRQVPSSPPFKVNTSR